MCVNCVCFEAAHTSRTSGARTSHVHIISMRACIRSIHPFGSLLSSAVHGAGRAFFANRASECAEFPFYIHFILVEDCVRATTHDRQHRRRNAISPLLALIINEGERRTLSIIGDSHPFLLICIHVLYAASICD